MLRFQGHLHLRQRLLMATLSQKSIRIDKIRSSNSDSDGLENTGLMDYEVSLLRLLENVSNGCSVEISYSGTSLIYRPGIITGGTIAHDCPPSRAIGYYLEVMIALAPFSKLPFNLTLTGITNDNIDVSIDTLRTVTLPTLKRFIPDSTAQAGLAVPLELKLVKRGLAPLGGGQVQFRCPVIRSLLPPSSTTTLHSTPRGAFLSCTDPVQLAVKRIRGIVYSSRVSPATASRVVEAARPILTRFLPDVYIYTDVCKGPEAGKSPGYGISLVAESVGGHLHSVEVAFQPRAKKGNEEHQEEGGFQHLQVERETSRAVDIITKDTKPQSTSIAVGGSAMKKRRMLISDESDDDEDDSEEEEEKENDSTHSVPTSIQEFLESSYSFPTPEDLGVRAARLLLTEIRKGGTVDTTSQWMTVLMLVLCPEDVGKVRVGGVGNMLVQFLRDVKAFFGTQFNVEKDGNDVVLTCLGTGYVNVNKAVA